MFVCQLTGVYNVPVYYISSRFRFKLQIPAVNRSSQIVNKFDFGLS